jgi:conjugative transfer signal peptidase TraF
LLVWNASTSVPVGLYRIEATQPKRGELALVQLSPAVARLAARRDYLRRSAFLLKPVAATVGDRVCRHGAFVVINGIVVTTARFHDIRDRVLPAWHGCRQLAFGDVLLLGRSRDSFDGRYFGPIPANRVVGRAHPLWTF